MDDPLGVSTNRFLLSMKYSYNYFKQCACKLILFFLILMFSLYCGSPLQVQSLIHSLNMKQYVEQMIGCLLFINCEFHSLQDILLRGQSHLNACVFIYLFILIGIHVV